MLISASTRGYSATDHAILREVDERPSGTDSGWIGEHAWVRGALSGQPKSPGPHGGAELAHPGR
jgi:hypothetical protein